MAVTIGEFGFRLNHAAPGNGSYFGFGFGFGFAAFTLPVALCSYPNFAAFGSADTPPATSGYPYPYTYASRRRRTFTYTPSPSALPDVFVFPSTVVMLSPAHPSTMPVWAPRRAPTNP